MLTRRVYWRRASSRGDDVVALLARTAEWSPRTAREVADDIESGRVRYVIEWEGGGVEVVARKGPDGAARLDAPGPLGEPTGGLAALPTA